MFIFEVLYNDDYFEFHFFVLFKKKAFFDVSLAVSRPSFSNLFSQIVGGDVFDDGGAVNVDLTI